VTDFRRYRPPCRSGPARRDGARRRLIVPALAALLACETAPPPLLIQNAESRRGVSLNGRWKAIIDPFDNGWRDHRDRQRRRTFFEDATPKNDHERLEYSFDDAGSLRVPGDWNTQRPELFFYEGVVWYRRTFDLQPRAARRYVLHFGAANRRATVGVNGAVVGEHIGGFTPFQFDVTDHLRSGENSLVVRVDNQRRADGVPARNTDWWNYGGLTRPVRLLELPRTTLQDYTLRLHAESDTTIAFDAWFRDGPDEPVDVEIPELGIAQRLTADGEGRVTGALDAPSLALWSPEHPTLYTVQIHTRHEEITDRIGFKRIETRGSEILLNGEPVFLRGVSLHEEGPIGDGRAWSEDHARALLGQALDLGCNFVRLAHYPHNVQMARVADELGLLVWAEIPVYWNIRFDSQAVYEDAERQLTELILRDRNRASVGLWSLANETPTGRARLKFLSRLAEAARGLDDTRLITAALDTVEAGDDTRRISDPLGDVVDVIGVNSYCGWYGRDLPSACRDWRWESDHDKPMIMSEFGAGARYGLRGHDLQRWTEEYQANVYREVIAMMRQIPSLRGASAWALRDFRSPRRPLPGVQDYYNRKGLLSERGERKIAFDVLRAYYQELAAR